MILMHASYVFSFESTLDYWANETIIRLKATNCNRRFLQDSQESEPTPSLVQTILDSIASMNSFLESIGITLLAKVDSYLDGNNFSIGIKVNLRATLKQNATNLLELVTDFIDNATNPSLEEAQQISKLSPNTVSPVSNSSTASPTNQPTISLDLLVSNTVIEAGFDLTFGIDLRFNEIQVLVSEGWSLSEALGKGVALFIDSVSAYTSLIVDPIELEDVELLGVKTNIRDSHLAISAELRSKNSFSASVDSLIMDETITESIKEGLDLEFLVPVSSELVIDLPIDDDLVVSPIIKVETTNLVKDSGFEIDLDIGTFLDETIFGDVTLDRLFRDVSSLLNTIANFEPTLAATNTTSSSLTNLFNTVGALQDLSGALLTYVDLVAKGLFYIT
jgi:hypothetical protein